MSRQQREPLRELTNEERELLQKVSRSRSKAAEIVVEQKVC